ncbi:MAG: hypothetical protein ACH254_21345, partial [Candidatus Thiodiazotropha endolucinida]
MLFSDSESDMKHSLEMFDLYCKTWHLTVNVEKTKIVVFSSGRNKQHKFMFDGREVEVSNDYKYLGIYFTRGGSFNTAKKYIAEQANKALF